VIDLAHLINAGIFLLGYWAICLIIVGFALTLLASCGLILLLGRVCLYLAKGFFQ
jgi:hypothetical protein